MRRVHDVKKMTDNPYLNMYALDMCDECGKHSTYYLASRNQSIEDLKLSTGVNGKLRCDCLCGLQREK